MKFMPIVTAVSVAAAIILSFIGSGALGGTPINAAADGALSTDATPFAPAGPAFSIWSLIYLGLVAYAIYQLLPAQRASTRHAALRPWASLSALLNAAWIGVVQAGSVLASEIVIIVLLVVLVRLIMLLPTSISTRPTDKLVTDGTFGLYLGWVFVATIANTAALLGTTGVTKFSGWQLISAVILVVVGVVGVGLARATGGRIAPALTITWGLGWIAVARTSGEFASPILIWAAALAGAVVLVATIVIRLVVEHQRAKTSWDP